jgi:hypothetical protein
MDFPILEILARFSELRSLNVKLGYGILINANKERIVFATLLSY